MDYTAEKHFVKTFIRKNRRERLLYELTTPGKRYDGVSRFCHQSGSFINPAKILMQGEGMCLRPEFKDYVSRHDEMCFVLSPDYYMDERYMTLKDAVGQALVCFDAVIIMGSTFAVVFGEDMKGGREQYLLSE
jgi:hypothetical protein